MYLLLQMMKTKESISEMKQSEFSTFLLFLILSSNKLKTFIRIIKF